MKPPNDTCRHEGDDDDFTDLARDISERRPTAILQPHLSLSVAV
jgi:hypothetical protein